MKHVTFSYLFTITVHVDFRSCINNWCYQNGTMGQYTRCKSVSNNGRTCHNPEIKFGSMVGGKPGGVWYSRGLFEGLEGDELTKWCKQLFPTASKIYGSVQYKVTNLAVFILKVQYQ